MAGSLDSLGSIFGDQKNTTTTGQQSGQSSSTGTNFANTAGTGRTGSNYDWAIQGGIGGLPNAFAPGIATGQSIAQFGLDPASIAAFQSPYTQQVVDATKAQFARDNSLQNSQNSAYAAKQGALTGSGAGGLRTQTQEMQGRTQAPVIAGLYNQGFSQAADLANKSLQARMGGASLANQGVGAQYGALGNLIGLGGQTTANTGTQTGGQSQFGNFSGQSSGTSDTTSWNPFGTMAGIAGGAAKVLPFLRDGGSVPAFAMGGEVGKQSSMPHHNPHMDKLMGTLEPLMRTMKKAMSNGGEIKGYEDGGDIGFGSSWDAKVTPAVAPSFTSNLSNAFDAFGQGYRQFNPQRQSTQPTPGASDDNGIAARMQDLAKGFASIRGYDDGGLVEDGPMRLGAGDVAPPSSGGGMFSSVRDYFAHPDRQKVASYLASMRGSPFAPSEANVLAQRDTTVKERQADLAAARLAQEAGIATGKVNINNVPTETIAGLAAPGQRSLVTAQTAHAQAGSEPAQIRIKAIEQENAAYQQRIQGIDDMELVDRSKGANADHYRQLREAARIAHEASLARLKPGTPQGGMPADAGAEQWNPRAPKGGLQ